MLPLQLLFLLKMKRHKRTVLTLHEFSRALWLRRIYCLALASMSRVVMTTSDYERKKLEWWTTRERKIRVVPIGSNIPRHENLPLNTSRRGIVFFGLLAPGKGLERFFEIISIFDGKGIPISIIGNAIPGSIDWLSNCKMQYPRVSFHQDLSPDAISSLLHVAQIAILPYPDGISERRGSALAALANGLQVVTTKGAATTDALSRVCHLFDDNAQAQNILRRLLSGEIDPISPGQMDEFVDRRSWANISEQHLDIYKKLDQITDRY